MVVFVIDLWDAAGPLPETMNDVLWRAKQIQYASRTAHHVDAVATKMNLRHAMSAAEGRRGTAGRGGARRSGPVGAAAGHRAHRVSAGADQIANSDAEFSRSSIAERRAAGYRDMQAALWRRRRGCGRRCRRISVRWFIGWSAGR